MAGTDCFAQAVSKELDGKESNRCGCDGCDAGIADSGSTHYAIVLAPSSPISTVCDPDFEKPDSPALTHTSPPLYGAWVPAMGTQPVLVQL